MSVLPDLLAPNLDIVFCGTAVGSASARRGAYYAGPGNAFWSTLFAIGLTPCLIKPEDYRSMLDYRLGLTDLVKTTFGNDAGLMSGGFDMVGFREKILQFNPLIVAFTSKRAAQEFLAFETSYGLLSQTIGDARLFVLCSPSGAARSYWNIDLWYELARIRDDLVSPSPFNVGCRISVQERAPP